MFKAFHKADKDVDFTSFLTLQLFFWNTTHSLQRVSVAPNEDYGTNMAWCSGTYWVYRMNVIHKIASVMNEIIPFLFFS